VAYLKKKLLLFVPVITEESGINLCTSRLSCTESNPGPPHYETGAVTLMRELTAQTLQENCKNVCTSRLPGTGSNPEPP